MASGVFKNKFLKYIIIDFNYRDIKKKRFFDIKDLKNDFFNFYQKFILKLNKQKNKVKFFLI